MAAPTPVREFTYGHYHLQLFDGAIDLPIKVLTSKVPESYYKLPTVRGMNDSSGVPRKTKQIYVLLKDNVDNIRTLRDVENFATSWTDLDPYLPGSEGTLKPFSAFKGLEELVRENEAKKKEKDMDVLGFYDKTQISFKYFNGRQYYVRAGEQKQKTQNPIHVQLYQCLLRYLKKNDKYLLVRFFSRSGEELGVLYNDGDYIRLSGIDPESWHRETPPNPKVDHNKDVYKEFSRRVNEFIEAQDEKPELKLEWYDYYLKCLSDKGVFENSRRVSKKKKREEASGGSLLEMLSGIKGPEKKKKRPKESDDESSVSSAGSGKKKSSKKKNKVDKPKKKKQKK